MQIWPICSHHVFAWNSPVPPTPSPRNTLRQGQQFALSSAARFPLQALPLTPSLPWPAPAKRNTFPFSKCSLFCSHIQAFSPAVPSVCNTSTYPFFFLANSYLFFRSQFSSRFLRQYLPDLQDWACIPACLLPLCILLIAIFPAPSIIFWHNVIPPEIFFGWLQLLKNKQILP